MGAKSQKHRPRSAEAKDRTALRKETNRTEQAARERRNRALGDGELTPWQQAQAARAERQGRAVRQAREPQDA